MLSKRVLLICGLAFLTIAIVSALDLIRPQVYLRLCNLYRDGLSRSGRTTSANSELVFLAIDAASVNLDESDIEDLFNLEGDDSKAARALHLMSKRFPWSREVYGLVLERLVEAGAKVVAFDLTFPGPSDADPEFRAALNKYADHVVVGSNFVDGTLTRPTDTLIEQTSPIDNRIGFTNFWADDDDVIRRARFHVTFDQVRGTPTRPGSENFSSLAAIALTKAGFGKRIPPDGDDHGVRFTAGPREGFPPRSLFEIFVPAFWERNYESGKFFRGKIVLVGAEGNWQHDDHPTPFGNMPGAEVHLNVMNAALHGEFLKELSPPMRVACCAIAGVIAVLLSLGLRMPWIRFTATVALSGAGVWLGYFCSNRFSVYLPMVAPVTVMNATMLFGLVRDFTSEHLEKARLRRTLERYISRDVVHEMIDRPQEYSQKLGGVVRPAAVLFSDIRSYSSVVSQSTPELLVAQLNEYFTAMVQCVFEHGGTLDKFIGDALMAVWGTLHSEGARADAVSAVRAALSMRKRLVDLNATWRERGWPALRVGTGINYGDVVVGNIGSPQRMEFTVIGDAVNLSWRLQELTKQQGGGIMLSSSVALLLADEFPLRPIPNLTTGPIREAYEICEPNAELLTGPPVPSIATQVIPMPQVLPTAPTTANR
jgi:adenylate cyclase